MCYQNRSNAHSSRLLADIVSPEMIFWSMYITRFPLLNPYRYLLLILTCFEFNINLFRNSAVYIIRFIETVTSQMNRKVRVESTYSDWFVSQGFGAFDFELASIPSSAQQNTAEP